MAHRVKFSIPEGELANLDVELKIRVDGENWMNSRSAKTGFGGKVEKSS